MSNGNSAVDMVAEFWNEVFNQGNFDVIESFVGPAYTYNGSPQSAAQLTKFARSLRSGIEDLHFTIDEIFGDDEHAAIRWTLTGTNAVTREPVDSTAINMIRFVDGQAFTNWQVGPTKIKHS